MSDLHVAIKARLRAHTGLSALVSTRSHAIDAPQGETLPYVVFEQVDGSPLETMSGTDPLNVAAISVAAVGATSASALAVADQVNAALEGYAGTSGGIVVQRIWRTGRRDNGLDAETRTFEVELEYRVWYEEA